jgi:hypothetical protein
VNNFVGYRRSEPGSRIPPPTFLGWIQFARKTDLVPGPGPVGSPGAISYSVCITATLSDQLAFGGGTQDDSWMQQTRFEGN